MTSSVGQPHVETLSNGISLIRIHIPATLVVRSQMIVRAGSRDETPHTAGLAHFTEHMLFKGTRRRPRAVLLSRAVEDTGGWFNAYTSAEMVSYHAGGPAWHLRRLSGVICDMMSEPLFDANELEREKGAVLAEMAAAQQDPWDWMFGSLGSVAYGGGHGLSWPVIGFESVVASATRDQLLEYHHRLYDPTATAFVVCGGSVLTVAQAERLVADIPHGYRQPRVRPVWGQGDLMLGKSIPVKAGERQQVDGLIALQGVSVLDPDYAALGVLEATLTGGESSRLADLGRRQPELATALFADVSGYTDAGTFCLAFTADCAGVDRAVAVLVEELNRLANVPMAADELGRVQNVITAGLLRRTEGAGALADFYARRWALGQPLATPRDVCAETERVSAADVQRVAQTLVSRLPEARLIYTHPHDLATGRNELGQGLEEQGTAILASLRGATARGLT